MSILCEGQNSVSFRCDGCCDVRENVVGKYHRLKVLDIFSLLLEQGSFINIILYPIKIK